ncbi:hypothetical protein NPIL_321011 [Nephila pilipes]|uniref:Uncharacterized protein n=1 Tax=Nephila pilipes TaxID=299642 RepID=A0A8X6JRL2_NEPPI|nr:hypothetical protein NPIL_321011 [Nephila pilipes]
MELPFTEHAAAAKCYAKAHLRQATVACAALAYRTAIFSVKWPAVVSTFATKAWPKYKIYRSRLQCRMLKLPKTLGGSTAKPPLFHCKATFYGNAFKYWLAMHRPEMAAGLFFLPKTAAATYAFCSTAAG